MRQHSPTDAKDLQRRLPDRMVTALRRYRRGGRRARVLRRSAAVVLLVAAAVIASSGHSAATDGIEVAVAARDMAVGSTLTARDLRPATVRAAPDGAVRDVRATVGRTLAAPVRRGEILTDVRLLDASGPRPGPGRVAVPVHLGDGAMVDLLRAGMHLGMVAVSGDDAADDTGMRVLTDDAVVLSVADPASGALSGAGRDAVLLVAVPSAEADAVAAAGLTGAIAVRFR